MSESAASPASPSETTTPTPAGPARGLPATWRQLLVFLAVLALISLAAVRGKSKADVAPAPPNRLAVYASIAVGQWVLVAVFARVLRKKGVAVASVIGPRWTPRTIARDFLLALGFWFAMTQVLNLAKQALHIRGDADLQALLPHTTAEAAAWVLLSFTAGFCEEFIFRGYLQGLLLTLTKSPVVAIGLQAAIFGLSHAYQGVGPTVAITIYALFIGTLAYLSRSLRPGMIAHAWQDVFSGLFSPG